MKRNLCKEPGCGAPADSDVCESCCEREFGHECDPDEGFLCLNCGYDGTEDAFSSAYDRAKDLAKYGE